jgi:hypothetical protein
MDSILSASQTLSYFLRISPRRAISITRSSDSFLQTTNLPHPRLLHSFQTVSFTICIHNPPSLPSHSTFYPLPAITPRDEVDRLITSFSYPPHSFLFYSFNLYYFANPSSRRLCWRVAWRLPFFLVLFCRPYKPRLLPIFLCALSNISQLQSRHVAAILVSYLQLFCVFTIIIPQSLKGFPPILSIQISFTPNYTGPLNCYKTLSCELRYHFRVRHP